MGTIFARGGSKGIPRKNIRPLAHKPLIAYAIEAGLGVPLIDRLIVSTDDEDIAKIARQYGAQVPFLRPRRLAADYTPELLAWKHAVDTMEKKEGRTIDILVSIPPTSPLRRADDVTRCIEKLIHSDADIVITVAKAHRSPYFNMVALDRNGRAHLLLNTKGPISQRQQAPVVYDMTTVAYAAWTDYIRKASSLMSGKVRAVIIPKERALDIDTMFDFEIAELLMTNRNGAK